MEGPTQMRLPIAVLKKAITEYLNAHHFKQEMLISGVTIEGYLNENCEDERVCMVEMKPAPYEDLNPVNDPIL